MISRTTLIRCQLASALIAAGVLASGQTTEIESVPILRDRGYQAITASQRLKWWTRTTVGPESPGAGLVSAGLGTASNRPREYHGTWGGFGKRNGMRLTGVPTGNAMEAGLGALWGEDPRYLRACGRPFGERVLNVITKTLIARRPDGHIAPAYARFIATLANNFLSNTWRADSETNAGHAALRTLWGFMGRMGNNAFQSSGLMSEGCLFHKRPLSHGGRRRQ